MLHPRTGDSSKQRMILKANRKVLRKGRELFMIRKRILIALFCSVIILTVNSVSVNAHTHAYSEIVQEISNIPGPSHPYIVGTLTDSNGKVTYIYGDCETVFRTFRKCYKCGCGARGECFRISHLRTQKL